MTLFKFTTPATKDYADQADGNDWNRLINALTGSVTENFTFNGTLTMAADISVGTNKYKTGFGQIVDNTDITAMVLQPNSGNTAGTFFIGPAGTSTNAKLLVTDNSSFASGVNRNDVRLEVLSGVCYLTTNRNTGSGATYPLTIRRSQASGTTTDYMTFNADSTLSISQDTKLAATKKFYVDGGGDTYIQESSANTLDVFAGGVNILKHTSTLITAGVDISIGAQKIKTTNIEAFQGSWIASPALIVENQTTTSPAYIVLKTTQTSTGLNYNLHVGDNTNYSRGAWEWIGSSKFVLNSYAGGTGTLRPIEIQMNGTAALTINTASPYVQFQEGSTGAGSAALGSNSPASTLTAPYTWIKVRSSDGSTVYVPAWK